MLKENPMQQSCMFSFIFCLMSQGLRFASLCTALPDHDLLSEDVLAKFRDHYNEVATAEAS